jgi:hypothetical protein
MLPEVTGPLCSSDRSASDCCWTCMRPYDRLSEALENLLHVEISDLGLWCFRYIVLLHMPPMLPVVLWKRALSRVTLFTDTEDTRYAALNEVKEWFMSASVCCWNVSANSNKAPEYQMSQSVQQFSDFHAYRRTGDAVWIGALQGYGGAKK